MTKRRIRLTILKNEFQKYANIEKNELQQLKNKILVEYASFMNDNYTRLEESWIANFALKDQLELLKDIVIQLPDVKNNPAFLQDIEKLFKKYDRS